MAVIITKPPESLSLSSLADLYEQFHALFVGKDFRCPRGIPIIIMPHHFFHLVKLQKGMQTEFTVEVEEPLIKATKEGFGPQAGLRLPKGYPAAVNGWGFGPQAGEGSLPSPPARLCSIP